MNTNVYFVFLLAIGLSAKSEFLVDFNEIIKLKDGKTYLDCSENCDEVKETACKCVHLDHCVSSTVSDCIKTGLRKFNVTNTPVFNYRVDDMLENLTNEVTPQWPTLVSPKIFLEYIRTLFQKSNSSPRVRRELSKKKGRKEKARTHFKLLSQRKDGTR